jgi:diguanylate cyclase (GGDEF)-like protein
MRKRIRKLTKLEARRAREGSTVADDPNQAAAHTGKRAGGALNLVAVVVVPILYAIVIATTILLTIHNNNNLETILEKSVKSELIATCISARNIISSDLPLFKAVDGDDYIEEHYERWSKINDELRELKNAVGAQYIYALRAFEPAGGTSASGGGGGSAGAAGAAGGGGAGGGGGTEYRFVFDTDEETDEIFTEYDLDPVHEKAFEGEDASGLLNSVDEWGTYNTGAVPIYEGGKIIGIVGVDYEDQYIEQSKNSALASEIVLLAVLVLSLGALIVILAVMASRNRKMQAKLYRVANFDVITGLPNRYFLYSNFAKENSRLFAERHPFAVLFIDLDNFKKVNDGAGHEAGDELLRIIAAFLRKTERDASDAEGTAPVSMRIGGDEFLQIVAGVTDAQQAFERAQKMLDEFQATPELAPFIRDYQLGLSIGIALYPEQSESFDELIRYSDIAMYASKQQGKNGFSIYEESMDSLVMDVQLSIRQTDRKKNDPPS